MSFHCAVIIYPGSNCDRDCKVAVERSVSASKVSMVWHEETSLPEKLDVIILPGGFSYGDYLRCGAMAALSPIMPAVKAFADKGGAVLGICNGFQILCESGLLPGSLLRNSGLKYVCKPIDLLIETTNSRFTAAYGDKKIVTMTQGNGDGNFYTDSETLKSIEDNGQVLFRYVDNPNGSLNNIAGLCNKAGNVLGMMPHPDRAFEEALGSKDGALLFQSLAQSSQVFA